MCLIALMQQCNWKNNMNVIQNHTGEQPDYYFYVAFH